MNRGGLPPRSAEEKIRRAQIRKSEENFFVGWRALARGGGAASLVPFKVSSREVYNYSTRKEKSKSFGSYSILGLKTNSRFRILGEENFLIISRKVLVNQDINMNSQKGFANIVLIAVIVILVVAVGYFAFVKKSEPVAQQPVPSPTINTQTQTPPAANNPSVQNPSQPSSADDVSSLQFTYGSDVFTLKKGVASTGINVYEFRAGYTSTVRVYTFVPNDSTVYTQGTLGGVDTKLFILWRGSGANIIEPILFTFRKNGDIWKQVAYAKLPPDGGRTTIESFSVANESIVLDVKTSGPDRNYHETYVPKHYVYKLSGNQLLLQ